MSRTEPGESGAEARQGGIFQPAAQAGQKAEVGVRLIVGGWQRNTEAQVLGRLEADQDPRVQPVLDVLGTEAGIAPGLQEPLGQVLSRAHTLGDGLAFYVGAFVKSLVVGAKG